MIASANGVPKMKTFRFDVQGMTCSGCTGSVQRALSRLDGVAGVDVSLQPGSATVRADPARLSAAQIVATLAELGYDATARADA